MTKFGSYSELETYLKDRTDLCMLLRYLLDCVKEETEVLIEREKELTGKVDEKQNKIDAQEHYVEEINYFIQNDFEPTAMTIMGYRRKPKSWAIADSIKRYERNNVDSTTD